MVGVYVAAEERPSMTYVESAGTQAGRYASSQSVNPFSVSCSMAILRNTSDKRSSFWQRTAFGDLERPVRSAPPSPTAVYIICYTRGSDQLQGTPRPIRRATPVTARNSDFEHSLQNAKPHPHSRPKSPFLPQSLTKAFIRCLNRSSSRCRHRGSAESVSRPRYR